MRKRVMLADDHQLLLEGIRTIIEDIGEADIVATANNGTELLGLLSKDKADLVILDLNMPGQDGLKCLSTIKRIYASVKVLVLTSYNQPELVEKVKELGADGYVIKNAAVTELKEAVQRILEGGTFFPQVNNILLPSGSYFFDPFLKKFQLTKREVDIIRLICSELSTKQIAAQLFLSEFTVNTHRKNIFRKLNVKNVAGLMNFAKENQLV
jgi:DNA-binding NarL/FixJ family response regulator